MYIDFYINLYHLIFQIDMRFNNDRNLTYSVSYTPKTEGPHKVRVLFGGREIPKSPYTVMVEGHPGDPGKVTASGPGLQPDGVVVNRPTYFDIFTKGAGRGVPEVIILDPQVRTKKLISVSRHVLSATQKSINQYLHKENKIYNFDY